MALGFLENLSWKRRSVVLALSLPRRVKIPLHLWVTATRLVVPFSYVLGVFKERIASLDDRSKLVPIPAISMCLDVPPYLLNGEGANALPRNATPIATPVTKTLR